MDGMRCKSKFINQKLLKLLLCAIELILNEHIKIFVKMLDIESIYVIRISLKLIMKSLYSSNFIIESKRWYFPLIQLSQIFCKVRIYTN